MFRDLMQRTVHADGVCGLSADAICCSFQPIDPKEPNVYLGFKRIPDNKRMTHADLLNYIKPGNAAIIMKTTRESENEKGQLIAGRGHYTCAWKEDNKVEAYHYFDSVCPEVKYCNSSASFNLDFQQVDQKRVLFVFNLPLDPPRRRLAIKNALENLKIRLNRILRHCLSLNLPYDIDFFPHCSK